MNKIHKKEKTSLPWNNRKRKKNKNIIKIQMEKGKPLFGKVNSEEENRSWIHK